MPSPVLPDGSLVSLPIGDRRSPVPYAGIRRAGLCLGDLVEDLTGGKVPREHLAHLDPDLDPEALPRPPGWRPVFGQEGAALTHLRNQGVGPGDLFLFFGWFRDAERHQGRWRHCPGAPPVHLLWGWLAIGTCQDCGALPEDLRAWAAGHPHLQEGRSAPNALFLAAGRFHLGGRSLPGAGIFPGRTPARTLTAAGGPVSRWRLPAWTSPATGRTTLSYHRDPDRWTPEDAAWCHLQTVGKGQEFVLATTATAARDAWLAQLFQDVPTQ